VVTKKEEKRKINMSLIERFTSRTGEVIRVQGTSDEPLFCAKDVCRGLGIANYAQKVQKLDADEKILSVEQTSRGKRNMLFVTEPGLYSIILTCRGATTRGTPAHAFRRWVTHEVLPTIRRTREYKLRESIAIENREEKGRRLWIVVKNMDVWNYNARRKHFSKVCRATERFCYTDEFNSPHVSPDQINECRQCIRQTLAEAILESVPQDQRRLTDMWLSSSFNVGRSNEPPRRPKAERIISL
jgi:prophage antirepressor-like protein